MGARVRQPHLLPSWLKTTQLAHQACNKQVESPASKEVPNTTRYTRVYTRGHHLQNGHVYVHRAHTPHPRPRWTACLRTPRCPHAAWRVRKYKCICTWTHTPRAAHRARRPLYPHKRDSSARGIQGSPVPTPRLQREEDSACPARSRPGASSFRPPARLSVRATVPPRPGRCLNKSGAPRIPPAPGLGGGDSVSRRGRATPPAHPTRAVFPGAA